jgi:hypothetical protein
VRLQAEDDAITAQNDAIWGLIAPFLANQIARITIDFKMSIINTEIQDPDLIQYLLRTLVSCDIVTLPAMF